MNNTLFSRLWQTLRPTAGLNKLDESIQAVTRGDLSRVATDPASFSEPRLQIIDAMCVALSNRVAQIRNNATIIALAGQQLAQGTQALSDRTDQQANGLASASAQVQELGAIVTRNAQAANGANAVADRVSQVAESGESLMRGAVQQVRRIEGSSREMSEIIAVIDGIAFQTNILALNAAVEAARAGDQGRGFAVVASEVRSLAKRSADSAAKIKALITQSAEQMEDGVRQIEQAGASLSDIVKGVRELRTHVADIAGGSAAQVDGLHKISHAVGSAEELTQQNADMVRESAKQAQELELRTQALSNAATAIRLRQGAADEAYDMVERACAFIERSGLRAAAARIFDKTGEFFDRDMYIFIFNRNGIFTAFGPNPSLTGAHLREIPGLQWERLLSDGFRVLDQNGNGWVEYSTVNPTTGAVNEKISYVRALPGDLLIGSGVYRF